MVSINFKNNDRSVGSLKHPLSCDSFAGLVHHATGWGVFLPSVWPFLSFFPFATFVISSFVLTLRQPEQLWPLVMATHSQTLLLYYVTWLEVWFMCMWVNLLTLSTTSLYSCYCHFLLGPVVKRLNNVRVTIIQVHHDVLVISMLKKERK